MAKKKSEIDVLKRPKKDEKSGEKESRAIRQAENGGQHGHGHVVNARKVSEGLQQLGPDAMRRLRDSFSLLDSDGTGTVSKSALRTMLQSLGMDSSSATITEMLQRTGEPITFGSYLAVMAELMCGLPSRRELEDALEAFQNSDGTCDLRAMREALLGQGNVSPEDVDAVINYYSTRSKGSLSFDKRAFVDGMGGG